jgi:hypothetical protein
MKGPHDDVHRPRLILERGEHDTLGGGRALAVGDDAARAHLLSILGVAPQLVGGPDAPGG